MATYTKQFLSSSLEYGSPIKVVATSSPGTDIHNTGGLPAKTDEVWLYAYNSASTSVLLTIQFAGTTSPDNDIKVSVPSQSGLTLVVPGLLLRNVGDFPGAIKAYAATANVITISGYVNRIS